MRLTEPRNAYLAATTLAFAVLASACGPAEPANGSVVCGEGEKACPDGYRCVQPQNTCWKNGSGPDGAVSVEDASAKQDSADSGSAGDAAGVDLKDLGLDGQLPETGGDDAVGDAPKSNDASTEAVKEPDAKDDLLTSDVASGKDASDAVVGSDGPILGPDVPIKNDGAIVNADAGCTSSQKLCNGVCIDASGCCTASDCSGGCMACGANHTCAAIKNEDDPTGRCAGTCDSTGTCRSKQGQACDTVSGGCVSSTTCADGYCCEKACNGSCEACDVSGSLGSCVPLPAGTSPRAGRQACIATDATCAGQCNGISTSCSYPTIECGTASCSGSTYQAAGHCSSGACVKPAPETCDNVCSVSAGGCTGVCTPNAKQCSASGVPQVCSSSGAWQNQAACGTGFTCTNGTCTCASPKLACGNACIDVQSDANNCGACNHNCMGGTCVAGKCQPVAIVSNLEVIGMPGALGPIGVDGTYLYYQLFKGGGYYAYRVSKTATNGTGTLLWSGVGGNGVYSYGVADGKLLYQEEWVNYACDVSTGYSCGSSAVVVGPNLGESLMSVGSLAPQYATLVDTSSGVMFYWYSTAGSSVHQDFDTASGAEYPSMLVAGGSAYYVRHSAGVNSLLSISSSGSKLNLTNSLNADMFIGDANEKSVLLWDTTTGAKLYRVPLSGGSPQLLVTLGSAPRGGAVVEDSSNVYWFDGDGAISRCSPSNCSGTVTALASGQSMGPANRLFQDA